METTRETTQALQTRIHWPQSLVQGAAAQSDASHQLVSMIPVVPQIPGVNVSGVATDALNDFKEAVGAWVTHSRTSVK